MIYGIIRFAKIYCKQTNCITVAVVYVSIYMVLNR